MLEMSLCTDEKIPSLFSSPPPSHSSPFSNPIRFEAVKYLRSKESGNFLISPADGGKVPFPMDLQCGKEDASFPANDSILLYCNEFP